MTGTHVAVCVLAVYTDGEELIARLGDHADRVRTRGSMRDISVFAYGGAGNDTLHGSPNFDRLAGGAGDDRLYGAGETDQLLVGPGRDRLYGGIAGDDLLTGDDGPNVIEGNGGDDAIDGRGGDDQLDLGTAGAIGTVVCGLGSDHVGASTRLLLAADCEFAGYLHADPVVTADTVALPSACGADATLTLPAAGPKWAQPPFDVPVAGRGQTVHEGLVCRVVFMLTADAKALLAARGILPVTYTTDPLCACPAVPEGWSFLLASRAVPATP